MLTHVLAFLLLIAFPRKPITIMAPANPGGGWDQTARVIQQVLTKEHLLPVPSEVINRPGAGGTIGLAELVARGDPHTIMGSLYVVPSWDRRGGCASRKYREATAESADGVVILD